MGWIGRRLAIVAVLTLLIAQLSGSFDRVSVGRAEPISTTPLVKVQHLGTVNGAEKTLSQSEFQGSAREGLLALGDELLPPSGSAGVLTTVRVSSPIPFSHVGLRWRGSLTDFRSIKIEVRASRDGSSWTEWQWIDVDDDIQKGADGLLLSRLASLDVRDGLYNYAQGRLTLLNSGPSSRSTVSSLSFSFIDPYHGPRASDITSAADASLGTVEPMGIGKPSVISRSAWGTPDGQNSPNWPPEYRPVTAIIIHHTATSNSATDWAAEVRAIWYYHAVTNDWGDIGYNFLIDPNGSIYEGRAGGDDVVGGHALQYNWGSMGVAFLGDYTYSTPSGAAQNSMVNLLAWKADQRGIDPMVLSRYFVDKNLPTVMGHRDALNTACPGNGAYSLMNYFRSAVRDRIASQPASIQVLSSQFEPTVLPSGTLLKVTTTVRNNGSVTAQTQGPSPGYVYNEGEQYSSVEAENFGRFRVGVDFNGRTQTNDHPYRWGLGRDLAPGETTTVVGYVRLWNLKTTNYWTGAVQEGIAWTADGVSSTSIRVSSGLPPSSKVAPLAPFSKQPFHVAWSGTDTAVRFYVQYHDGPNGPWVDWPGLSNTTATSADFSGGNGHTYYFRSLAVDASGNMEQKSDTQFDTYTTEDDVLPSFVVSVPASTTHNWFVVRWSGSDSISGVAANYDVDVNDGTGWRPWLRGATGPSALYLNATTGRQYWFRVTGWDLAGNSNWAQGGPITAGSDPGGLSHAYLVTVYKNSAGLR